MMMIWNLVVDKEIIRTLVYWKGKAFERFITMRSGLCITTNCTKCIRIQPSLTHNKCMPCLTKRMANRLKNKVMPGMKQEDEGNKGSGLDEWAKC